MQLQKAANYWLGKLNDADEVAAAAAAAAIAEGKVDGWARHSKTFEDVYGWEAGALAAAAK